MSIFHRCRVTKQRELGQDIFLIGLELPLEDQPLPGTFIHLKVSSETDPLFRRPFSIYDYDPETKVVEVLYKVFGRGTRILSQAHVGDELDVLGPLGNSFAPLESEPKLVLVGGGVGIPPLYLLAKRCSESGLRDQKITFLCGLAGIDEKSMAERLEQLPIELQYSTDDGTLGHHGLVTDLLTQQLDRAPDAVVGACGPTGMLREVRRICLERDIRCYLSLESIMPCGVGACLGCVVKRADVDGYRRVCREGPVFPAEEIEL